MDTDKPSISSPNLNKDNPQSAVSLPENTENVANENLLKKRGQISVNKAFIIIYVLILVFILAGPEFVNDKSGTALDQLALLFNGGFLLIILVVILHIFFYWREKKKEKQVGNA